MNSVENANIYAHNSPSDHQMPVAGDFDQSSIRTETEDNIVEEVIVCEQEHTSNSEFYFR